MPATPDGCVSIYVFALRDLNLRCRYLGEDRVPQAIHAAALRDEVGKAVLMSPERLFIAAPQLTGK